MKYLMIFLLSSLLLPNSPVAGMKRNQPEENNGNNETQNTSKKQSTWSYISFQTENNVVNRKPIIKKKNTKTGTQITTINSQTPAGYLHEFSLVPEKISVATINPPIQQNTMFNCHYPGCGASFRSQRELITHEKVHSSQYLGYKCQFCNGLFVGKDELKSHISSHHLEHIISQHLEQIQPIPIHMFNPQSHFQQYTMPTIYPVEYQQHYNQQATMYQMNQQVSYPQESFNQFFPGIQAPNNQNNPYMDQISYTTTQPTGTYHPMHAPSQNNEQAPVVVETNNYFDTSSVASTPTRFAPIDTIQSTTNSSTLETQDPNTTNVELDLYDFDAFELSDFLDPREIQEKSNPSENRNQISQNSKPTTPYTPSFFLKQDERSEDSYDILTDNTIRTDVTDTLTTVSDSTSENSILITNPVCETQHTDVPQSEANQLTSNDLEIDLNANLEPEGTHHQEIENNQLSTVENPPYEAANNPDTVINKNHEEQKSDAAHLPNQEILPAAHQTNNNSNRSQNNDPSDSEDTTISLTAEEEEPIHQNETQPVTDKKTKKSELFICTHPGCNQTFVDKYNRVKHMRTHTGEKPYKCTFKGCKMAFAHKSNLNKHMDTHEDISTVSKHFKCTHKGCSQSFKENAKLVRHMLSHTGIKNFICEHKGCAKAFGTNDKLKRHMKTHSEKRNYKCSYKRCNKAYKDKSDLKAHEKTHTDTQEEFKCPISGCDKSYSQKKSLNRHLKTHNEKE